MFLNAILPINDTSYGITASHFYYELQKLGTRIALFPIGGRISVPMNPALEEGLRLQDVCEANAACLKIWHQFDMATWACNGPRLGFPIFELDKFSKKELHHLGFCDHLIATSKWGKQVYENAGFHQPKHVVPLGVDTEAFKPPEQPRKTTHTLFLHIGKWEKRKGHHHIIKCFEKAFTHKDNVALAMVSDTNPFISQQKRSEWLNLYQRGPLSSKVHIFDRMPNTQLVQLMQDADCGVFPSLAEGWNLPLLEMMSCGKHVIVTDYSAHTEFCTPENSLLIRGCEAIEDAFDGTFFFGQGGWLKWDDSHEEQLVDYMRQIHKKRQSGSLGINMAGLETAAQFTWTNAAAKLLDVIVGSHGV